MTPQMGMKVTLFIALTILAALVIRLIEAALGWPIALVFTLSAILYFIFDDIASRKPKEEVKEPPMDIKEAKKLLFNLLKGVDGVYGVGITTHKGKECLKVYYNGNDERGMPSSFLGFKVIKEGSERIQML